MTTGTLAIGQVQINNSFSGQSYLPYSLGVLQAFVQRHAREPSRYEFRLPVYRRMPVWQAVEQLLGSMSPGSACMSGTPASRWRSRAA